MHEMIVKTGLSPPLQWIAIPSLALTLARNAIV